MKYFGRASAASEATLIPCQLRFAVYVGLVRSIVQCPGLKVILFAVSANCEIIALKTAS